ncbi:MAG: DEAD/DEAH box helicase [Actinomycetia bacterium]|nr:DEAD/DEAH box helicase [Actinomycetes bacterium]
MSPTFAQLGVPKNICGALQRAGITTPFPIQALTIPDAMDGADICGRAPTGSGKTLAFGIPLVANAARAKSRRPRALVLSPTRELAGQIASELRTLSTRIRVGVIHGGVGYGAQRKQLQQGVEILVACPGRLEDLIDRRAVSLHEVDQVVIDEADRMADMGFLPAVRRLLDQTSPRRQTLMFSATLDRDVAKLTRDYQHQPVTHRVGDTKPDIKVAEHRFWRVAKAERIATCVNLINSEGSTIVFCRTRHGSDRLARQLSQRGVRAAAIHGGHAQSRRTRTLRGFIKGQIEALVATDVAARGIHVEGVATVIHYDPPENQKTYLHRSGRTARAGETGLVVSLIQPDQVAAARKIQRQLDLKGPITSPDRIDTKSTATPRPRVEDRNRRKVQSQPANGRRRPGSPRVNRNGQRALRSRPQRRNRSNPRARSYSR